MISKRFSHYRIIKKLGEGGMGEVYLAEDLRLGREVALKVLPHSYQSDPVRRERFVREARAASSLRSPHVAAIYDIGEQGGESFIAMEYVEGVTLAQRLRASLPSASEVARIAVQIGDALDEAHAAGIIHRDIKSSNVIINARGMVKVLDFGLAKLIQPPEPELEPPARRDPDADQSTDTTVDLQEETTAGLVVGTIPYMSPEQAQGSSIDRRSDIFSLGVVMYEMLTGRLPFEGENTTQLIDQIIHDQPAAIARFNCSVPDEFERIVRKCLDKEPGRRYQAIRDLLIDLRALSRDESGSSASPPEPARKPRSPRKPQERKGIDSLAILPLFNASGDPEAEYLSDGITEAIIKSLSQLPKLRVMASSTVFRYKRREVDPQQVGSELGVRAVLTGRVLLRGDALIVKTELVDVHDGSQIWGKHYNRRPSDIFAIEAEISREISHKLRLRLSREQKKGLAKRHTGNTEAYQAYLKGRFYWNRRTEEGLKKGIEYFQQAIDLDPAYALAYAGLADSYNMLASYSTLAPRDAFPKAKAAARRALEIDPNLPQAHTSLAFVHLGYDWEWAEANRAFKRAISLDPSYATAHHWYALYLIAMSRKREAFEEITRAQELEPLSMAINTSAGWLFHLDRQYEQAIDAFRKTLELEPGFGLARRRLGQALLEVAEFDRAIAEIESSLSGSDDVEGLAALGHAYAASGRIAEAAGVSERLMTALTERYVPSLFIARIQAARGERDEAFQSLEKAYDERHGLLVYLNCESVFDVLRPDARFRSLLLRVGLN